MYKNEESYLAEATGIHIGRQHGLRKGREEGYQQGLEDGYQQGRQDGYDAGWNEATAAGNQQILKQMEYTREHVAGRETLQAQVVEQIDLNARLHARVKQLEQENAEMMSAAKQVVAEDKALIQQLQQQLAISEAKARERAEQYANQLWQYNRCLTVLNAARGVLDELTEDASPHAAHVRQLFAEKYAQQVSKALKSGGIKLPPDADEEFARALPKTLAFIVRMLERD
jgi:hypothetical protein